MVLDFQRIQGVFQAVAELPPAERAALLERECAGDAELRRRVEALLKAHDDAGELPAAQPEPTGAYVPAVQPGQVFAGRYKLREKLGEGGMGVVFVAEQTEPVKRRVALKIIRAGPDTHRLLARFEQERQALALMDHPNIAKVFDAGVDQAQRPYFAMELVKGLPLTKYCDDARLSPRQRLELFTSACQAVQHAHQKGVIHRDLKPSNILVGLYDDRPVPKVIDFGVAKATGPRLTEQSLYTEIGSIIGTLEYMSPEQAQLNNLDIDTRSDIYALGVILYELLTGTVPFSRKALEKAGLAEMLRVIKEVEPAKPSTKLSHSGTLPSIAAQRQMEPRKLTALVRGELDWIVMKALEKDRNRRYETANGFAKDVQRYLADEPVVACPPSAGYRFRKFTRRNKVALATAAVVAAALLIGAAAATWQAVRASKAEGLAQERLETANANYEEAEAQRKSAKTQERLANVQRTIAVANEKTAREQELLARGRFYASQINLAQGAWDQGQPARVLELLEGQRPKFDQPDLRTFEWYYLWRRCHAGRRLRLDLHHPPENSSPALAPDGKTIAAQWGNSDIKLWDVASGRERLTLRVPERTVYSLAFAHDGQTLASGDDHGRLMLWDVSTGKSIKTLEQSPDLNLRSLTFSPHGKTLASGWENGTVKLWNVATWQEEITLRGHSGPVLCVTFSPDGKTLASASAWGGGGGGVVNLWDLSAKPPISRFRLSGSAKVAFSPDGKTLASGSFNRVDLWDVATGIKRVSHYTNSGKILCVAYSPDGKTLAIGHNDRTLKLWEPESGREQSYGHHDAVQWVAFSPDSKTVASASSRDGAVNFWDVTAAPEPATLPNGRAVRALAFSPDGQMLATGGDFSTKLWDLGTSQQSQQTGKLPESVGSVAYSHNGKTLAIATARSVELFAISSRQEQGALRVNTSHIGSFAFDAVDRNQYHGVKMLGFGPDDTTLAMAGQNVTGRVWDLATREVRGTVHGTALAFSPDKKTLATGTGAGGQGSGGVTLWDADTFKKRITFQGDRSSWVFCVQFSPDGKLVAQTTDYGTVLLWDVTSGALHASFKGHTSPVNCVAFHPDGKTLASASDDKTIKLWDTATGQERMTLTGHTGAVLSVAFSPDGNVLASGSDDKTVKLWRAATDREAMAPRTELEPNEPLSPNAMIRQADGLRSSGQPQAAEQVYRKAESRLEKLAAAFPNEASYRDYLAITQQDLGAVLKNLGKSAEAEAAYRHALGGFERMVVAFPRAVRYQNQLLQTVKELAQLLEASGQPQKKREILDAVFAIYEKLTAQSAITSENLQAMAAMYQNLANLLRDSGQPEEAEKAYGKGLAIREKLATDFPRVDQHVWDLAACYIDAGHRLQDNKRHNEAAQIYERARKFLEARQAQFPECTEYRAELGRIHNHIGWLLASSGRQSEAEKAHRQALDLYERLAQVRPKPERNRRHRQELAWTHEWLGHVLTNSNRPQEAEKAFRQSIALYEELNTEFPNQDSIDWIAKEYRNLAALFIHLSQWYKAEPACRQALALWQKLATDFPRGNYRVDAGHTLWQLASILSSTGRRDEAEKTLREALTLFKALAADYPGERYYRQETAFSYRLLCDIFAGAGRVREEADYLQRATKIYATLLAEEPNSDFYRGELSVVYGRLAHHFIRLSQWDKAAAQYAKADLLARPLRDDAFAYACLLLIRGDSEGYNRFCQGMIQRAGKTEDPFEAYVLARSGAMAGKGPIDPARAVQWANQAVTSGNHAWCIHVLGLAQYRAGQFDQALQSFTKANAEGWIYRELNWFGLALVHDRLGHPDKALRCLDKGIQWLERESPPGPGQPARIMPQDWLEAQLLRREALPQAVAYCREAIERDPKDAKGHYIFGVILHHQDTLDQAVAEYRKAIQLDPEFTSAHEKLATVLRSQGKLDEAVASLQELLRLKPEYAQTVNGLAWGLATAPERKNRDGRQAVALARLAVKAAPTDGSVWNTLGAAHYCACNWKETVATLQKSMELRKGGDSFDWFFLAMAHWQLGEKDKARKWFDQAAAWMDKNQPKNDELRRFRAEAAELMAIDGAKQALLPSDVVISPKEAFGSIEKIVTLEMTIASVGFGPSGDWMFLNSEADYRNPKNVHVAIRFPTPERRKAMGLDLPDRDIVKRRVRATGKVTLYREAPEIIIEQPEQLQMLPRANEERK